MLTFLTSGKLGNLRLGLSRQAVLDSLGEPRDWVGKPPGFGPATTDPMAATIWNFYGGAIGACFDESSKVAGIIARVNKITPDLDLFSEWPPIASWAIEHLVRWLDQNSVRYRLSREDEIPGWLVICENCVALSRPNVTRSGLGRFVDERLVLLAAFNNPAAAAYYRRTGQLRLGGQAGENPTGQLV